MASGEITATIPWENNSSNDTISPKIGVVVTADVRVVQFRSSHSLGNCQSRKCTIVTSLSAVIKESLDNSLKNPSSSRSTDVSNPGSTKAPCFLTENFDQPVVRRSKKHTQLNLAHITNITSSRRAQIDRTIILPHLGCTRRFKSFRSSSTRIFIKSSKSWETVGKSIKPKNIKPFLSQTCIYGTNNNTQVEQNLLGYQVLSPSEQIVYSSEEYELDGYNILEDDVRSFYLIRTPVSGPTIYSGKNNTADGSYIKNRQNTSSHFPKNHELEKNITGFDTELLLPSAKLSLKATRNVSILHRPKTRDKFTSTTSLNSKDLDKSIQGLLLPYVSNGRDFPSEIVLKLVPKAEVLKNTQNEAAEQRATSQSSSEANLLAPRLNTETDRKNKKSNNSFWNCFSSKKKKKISDTDDNSDSNSSKEVYFPSIVEVHKEKDEKNRL